MRSGNRLRALGGWLAGCAAASVILYASVLAFIGRTPRDYNVDLISVGLVGLTYILPIIFVITVVLTLFPAALIVWFSEKFELRSARFFGGAGVAIAVLVNGVLALAAMLSGVAPYLRVSWQFIVAGLVGGLVYWLVAGKHAGRQRTGEQA